MCPCQLVLSNIHSLSSLSHAVSSRCLRRTTPRIFGRLQALQNAPYDAKCITFQHARSSCAKKARGHVYHYLSMRAYLHLPCSIKAHFATCPCLFRSPRFLIKCRIYIKLFVGSRLARILHFDLDCLTFKQSTECDFDMAFVRTASTRNSTARACIRGRWMHCRTIVSMSGGITWRIRI